MDKVLQLDNVDTYNKLYGLETFNPLVSVVNLNKATCSVNRIRLNYGVYALFLKLEKACDIKYGRQRYDYEEGTIVCFAPGQTAETTPTTEHIQTNTYGLVFHPDLLRGTSLGKMIKKYTFFTYEVNEALHVSENERTVILDCLNIIQKELEHDIDKHSKTLITTYIELLLGYCMRFYERQFITRENRNRILLEKMEAMLDAYIDSGKLQNGKSPTPAYCSEGLGLSVPYFTDLLKFETGKTLDEYFRLKRLEVSKRMLLAAENTPSVVAHRLGFPNVQYFSSVFKKITGISPNDYRTSQN